MKTSIEKWILNKADKIRAQKEKEKKEREAIYNFKEEESRNIRKLARNAILENIMIIGQELEKKSIHIKEGDDVIVNKYDLQYISNNGWDGGASTILRNIPSDAPITGKIKEIKVNYSLIDEHIDIFLDNLYCDTLKKIIEKNRVWEEFKIYNDKAILPRIPVNPYSNIRAHFITSNLMNYFGLYMGATFTLDSVDFNPTWDINIYTFLPLSSVAGQATLKLWNAEFELIKEQENFKKLELEFQKMKDETMCLFDSSKIPISNINFNNKMEKNIIK